MKFYHLKNSYIDYLKQFDTKVPDNKNETRPYVGVVLEIDNIKYYAPFTSPKPKHQKMKNGKDFRKIDGGKLGAINFNNMIPVLECALIDFDIDSIQNDQYRRLLQSQYVAIRDDWENIVRTAQRLRILFVTPDEQLTPFDQSIKSRCCNLSILEENFKLYDND